MIRLFTDRGFYQYMFKLALPIAFQNLLMAAFQLIDAAMVAQLGNDAMAGVNMAGRWSFIMMITIFGIGSGSAILYSQYWGAKDEAGIRRVFGLALLNTFAVALLFGIAMALFPVQLMKVFAGTEKPEMVRLGAEFMQIIALNCLFFAFNFAATIVLRSTEEVRIPLLTSLLSISINTGLNFVLIYGRFGFPALGVRGAAISTLISSMVQMILLLTLARRRRHVAFSHIRQLFDFSNVFVKKYYKVVMPVIGNELFWVMGSSVYLMVFGRMTVEGSASAAPAAYSLFGSIDQLLFSFIIGMASACGVMVGKAVGAGEEQKAWDNALRFIVVGTAFAALLGLAEALLRVPLVDLIHPGALAGELTKQLLLIGSFALPLKMLTMLLIVAIFRAGGKPMMGAILDVSCVWGIGAPLVALAGLVFKLPFTIVFLLIFVEELVKVAVGLTLFFRRKWIHRLTDDIALPSLALQAEGAAAE